jgi:hypothetical protein
MRQVVGQAGAVFLHHRRGVLGHAFDKRTEGTAMVEVAPVEGDAQETAELFTRAAVASALLHCLPMNGSTWSAPCVRSTRQTRKPCLRQ